MPFPYDYSAAASSSSSSFDFRLFFEFWHDDRVTDLQRTALLDHELCHAEVAYDEQGEPKEDARGRTVYRIRKHDIEEFAAIVERHGLYKRDLEAFAKALRRAPQPSLDLEGDAAADTSAPVN